MAVEELLDLEQVVHHQGLESLAQKARTAGKPFTDTSSLYGAYIAQVSAFRASNGNQLKAVRVILPAPEPFRYHSARGLVLTAGVDAYILQRDAKGILPGCTVQRVQ